LPAAREEDHRVVQTSTEVAIRLGLLAVLIVLCYTIMKPFAVPVVWGVILAVAIRPLYERLARRMGGRRKTAATVVVLIALAVLIVPAWFFLGSITEELMEVAGRFTSGDVTVPEPPEGVREWPLIGEAVAEHWAAAAGDVPAFLGRHGSALAKVGAWILGWAASLGLGVLGFAFSIVIAGALLATAEGGTRTAATTGRRLAGEKGVELVRVSAATIRSVAIGVVGVAVVQAFLATAGFVVAGVPAAGVWGLVVLILAIVQLPTFLVTVPMIFYVYTESSTTGAILFAIWAVFVGISDNILRPLLLARGVEVPMLVILIGALGGLATMGILGLFVGAVVLAVGHQVWVAWTREGAAGEG